MKIGIIAQASQIPDGSIITKKTGTFEYKLVSNINIYGADQQKINKKNIKFLVKIEDDEEDNIKISAVPDDIVLVWWTTEKEYYQYMDKKYKDDDYAIYNEE